MSADNQGLAGRRRRHKAAGARVAVTGFSAGAVLGVIGAIGAHSLPSISTMPRSARTVPATAPPIRARAATTPTTIVWRVVHRVVVVTDPPVVTASAYGVTSQGQPSYAAPPVAATAAPGAPAPIPVAAPPPPPAPAPAPAPATPACSGTKCP